MLRPKMHSVVFSRNTSPGCVKNKRRHIHWTNCKTKLPGKNIKFGIDMSRKRPRLSDSDNEFETCEKTESNEDE